MFVVQKSANKIPDVIQTHVLLQTCGAAAVQRVDQQQRLQAVLLALCQMVSWHHFMDALVKYQSEKVLRLCDLCLGLQRRSPCASACLTLCRTSSTTWCLRWWSPHGTSWRTTWKQWVKKPAGRRDASSFLELRRVCSPSPGLQHWWCAVPPHQFPGQLPEGLHVDQPGASKDLLQTHDRLCHVHKQHAGLL